MKKHPFIFWFRWLVRFSLLALAVFFALGGPIPYWLGRAFPALSPLAVVSGAMVNRTWSAVLYWSLPPLIVLAFAALKGRFFCRWICPAGTLHALPAQVSMKKKVFKHRINGIFFWAIVGASLIGLPSLLFLDPLAGFNRITPWLNGVQETAALIPGLVFPFFLVLSFFQPAVWCSHVCPLGYAFDLVHARRKKPLIKQDETRRAVVFGLGLGVPLAFLGKYVPKSLRASSELPILPPGAKNPEQFAAACSRCYACVNTCPTRVIRIGMPDGDRSLGQYFQPELNHMKGYCDEFCNQCSQVCPTGALKPLTVDQKRQRQIGVAKVRKEACLAWADGEHCMVCQEFCPYLAIDTDESENGLPRPVVNTEICRGCGFCQNQCPAIRDGIAIIVHGVERQGQARDFQW